MLSINASCQNILKLIKMEGRLFLITVKYKAIRYATIKSTLLKV